MRFCGRVAELDELIARWKLARDIAAPSPQLVILKAERGVGKTRLALEFYRWLSENVDAKGPDGYWPDSASILDRSIDVNPDPYACRYDQSMPFLWWGLRAADPGTENRISGDAIASYDKFLAPHLVALTMKARAIKSGKALLGVWRDVAKGEAASWSGYDTVMSVGEGLFKTVQILRGTMEQSRSSALGEITKKSINRVDAVLEDLEIVLNTRSPGFAKTPAVILIDDAQFSTEDPGLADFCEKLLHMAMTQKWPLMILVTHWKRDLSPEFMTTERSFAGVVHHARTRAPHENGPVAGLPGGYLTPQNTVEIDLAPVPDLTEALHHALPGLLLDQAKALLEHAGGNPRHLEQIIAFLRENEEFFEDFDTANPLTEEGLREALEETHDILKVVMRRLRDAPIEVQEAICLASLQGMRFVSDIVNDLAKACLAGDRTEALKKAGDPFSMVSARYKASIAEFSERLFYLVAEKRRRSLKGLSDTAALTAALQDILRERIAQIDLDQVEDVDGAVMTFGLAAQAFAEREPVVALKSLSAIVKLEQARYAHSAAVAAAERFRTLFSPEAFEEASLDIETVIRVTDLLSQEGRNTDALVILLPCLDQMRGSVLRLQTPEGQRDLAAWLDRVGASAIATGDLPTATQVWQEGLSITRVRAARLQTPESLRDLSISLGRIGAANMAAGDLATAAQAWQESLSIARNLAEHLQTPKSRSDLAVILSATGEAHLASGELLRATQAWQESLDIIRDLTSGEKSNDGQRNLAGLLDRVGHAELVSGNVENAMKAWQEGLEISRSIAEKIQTPISLSDLAIALSWLGEGAHASGELQKALQSFEESLVIRRSLADRLRTPESLMDLNASLRDVCRSVKDFGDLPLATQISREALSVARELAARLETPESHKIVWASLIDTGDAAWEASDIIVSAQAWQESLTIARDLSARHQTPESQRLLSISLNKIGDAADAAGDMATAAEAWRESLGIARGLAMQLQTPQSQHDLSVSLNKVGDAAAAMGDLIAAGLAIEESLRIRRYLADRLQTPKSQRDVLVSLLKYGEAALAVGSLAEAEQALQEGLAVSRNLAALLQTPESRRDLATALHEVGKFFMHIAEFSEASQSFKEAVEITRNLASHLQTSRSKRDLSVSLEKLGDVAQFLGDPETTERSWKEGLDIARSLAQSLQTLQSEQDLYFGLIQLSEFYVDCGNYAQADALIKEGVSLAHEFPLERRIEAIATFSELRQRMG